MSCYASFSSGPRLLVEVGSGVVTCPLMPNSASLLRRAPTLPHVPWLWTLPPHSEGAWRCHTSCGSGPCLERALAMPHAPWLRTSSPHTGGLWRRRMSHGSGPCLPDREGSGAVMCDTPVKMIRANNVLKYQSLNQSMVQYIIQVVHSRTTLLFKYKTLQHDDDTN
jgi:hypothetical protein